MGMPRLAPPAAAAVRAGLRWIIGVAAKNEEFSPFLGMSKTADDASHPGRI
ncbi:MAG: hypothetical protein ACRENP_05970 [Longimicrobiales bacterium]